MQKSIAIAFMYTALAFPVVGHAQFGNLGKLLGGDKPSSNAGSDLNVQQDQLTSNYVSAGKDVMTANGHMIDALGIKVQSVNAVATSDTISASQIEEQDKAISADAKAVSDALKSGATLKDDKAKAKYAQGLVVLVSGLKKYIWMNGNVKSFSLNLQSASPLQLISSLQQGKFQSGAYIVKNLPTSIFSLSNALKSAIDFAKSNGVEVPADATSLL